MGLPITVGGKGLGGASVVQIPLLLVSSGEDEVPGVQKLHLLPLGHQHRLNNGNAQELAAAHNPAVDRIGTLPKGRHRLQQAAVFGKGGLQPLHHRGGNKGGKLGGDLQANILVDLPQLLHKGLCRGTGKAAVNALLQPVGNTGHGGNNNTDAITFSTGNHDVRGIKNPPGASHRGAAKL